MKTFISRTGSRSPHLTEQPTLSLQEKRKPGLREDRAGSRVGFTLGAASMQRAFPTSRDKSSRQYPAHDNHVGQRHSPGEHECPEQDTEGPKGPQARRRHSHWGAAEAQVGCDTHPPHTPTPSLPASGSRDPETQTDRCWSPAPWPAVHRGPEKPWLLTCSSRSFWKQV